MERFATKEDLKGFATKEDLERFATKEDLERFATKEDLKGFATKEDLENLELRIREDLKNYATKEDLEDLAVRMHNAMRLDMRMMEERLEQKFERSIKALEDRLMTILDAIVDRYEILRLESGSHTRSYKRLEDFVSDHGKRIIRLERICQN